MSTGRFELALAIVETKKSCTAAFHFHSNISQDCVKEFAKSFSLLLDRISLDPLILINQFQIFSDVESSKLASKSQNFINFNNKVNFIDWFERQAQETPNATVSRF